MWTLKKLIGGALVIATLVGGGISYFLASGPIDVAELAKAGFADCAMTSLTCPVKMTDDLKKIVSVKGEFSDMKYLSVALPAMKCLDAERKTGVIVLKAGGAFSTVERAADQLGIFDVSLCKVTDCADPKACASQDIEAAAQPIADSCAWRPKGGIDCTRADGSNPGDENTMMPGAYSGAGCVKKSCYVIAGQGDK